MEKKTIIISITILFILIIGGLFVFLYNPIIKAELNYNSGTVLVNDQLVNKDVKLSENDVIETKEGSATIILYESVIISLDPNTKISLTDLTKDNLEIEQFSGSTWNKFTKMLGISSYTASYGNTRASVRGTSFILSENKIITAEGEVEFEINGFTYRVGKDNVVELVDGEIVERTVTNKEKELIQQKLKSTVTELKQMRERIVEDNSFLIDKVKKTQDLTDEDIEQFMDEADNGELNLDELYQQSPIKSKSVEKVIEITKNIQKVNELIEK
jgi:hypothetical protein